MKKPFSWMVLLFFGASTLQHCSDPGESAAPEKVQFTWSLTDTGSQNGRSKIDRVPDALIVTVAKASGETLLENYRINLIRAGDAFISEPLSLTPGQYNITQFMLVAGENELLYAAPVKGAPLAPAVNRPLPFLINVSQGKVNRFDVEVLKFTEANFPEEFGYTSFTINDVNPLKISPFLAGENGLAFTTATAYIIEGEDTIKTQPLAARINLFSFRGEDRNTVRKLVVVKQGYLTYTREFKYIDFINELQGLPLEIIFKPAVFTINPATVDFQMQLGGESGAVSVDWGDGTSDTYDLNPEGELSIAYAEHHYLAALDYQIRVTGDLDKVELFQTAYGLGYMTDVSLQGLPNLKGVGVVYTNGPEIIDLSYNDKIERIMMPVFHDLRKIIFPKNKNARIKFLEITGPNRMTAADVDALINEFYFDYIVRNHVEHGTFILERLYNTNGEMLGPPSPASIQILRDMRDTYYWSITPNPQ